MGKSCTTSVLGKVCGPISLFIAELPKLLAIAFLTAVLTSCAGMPHGSKNGSLSVSDVQQGALDKELPLRWGGTIVSIKNQADVTVIEIVSRPLHASGRPIHNDASDGRFIAEISGFLDPEIVSSGRDISMIGKVSRLQEGTIGQAKYQFPVMDVFEHRVWTKRSNQEFNRDRHYFYPHDYWRDWPYRRRSSVRGSIIF